MIVVYGSTLYGKVRAVPGVCHVATRFLHLFFVPLFPTGSWLVIHRAVRAEHGVELVRLPALNWASVGLGWLRFFLFIALVVLAIVIATKLGLERPWADTARFIVAALACVAAFFFSYRLLPVQLRHIETLRAVNGIPSVVLERALAQLARSSTR
ncbi:MAG TPA: hypothetical protein VEQ59_08620 [Polyangiaceae bacterium]|nr:hypothetical protein [Polyangiaceae bacterium]